MAAPDSTLPVRGSDKPTIVDAAGVALCAGRPLSLSGRGYVILGSRSLHRLLTQAPPGMVVDHINGDRLDNRLCNLRVCTQAQNLANGRSHRDSASKYRGVSWRPKESSWRAQISVGGQRSRFLGQWATEEDAALAYDQAAREQYGKYARLNFPAAGPSAAHRYRDRESRRGLGLPMKRMGGPGGSRTHDQTIMRGLPKQDAES